MFYNLLSVQTNLNYTCLNSETCGKIELNFLAIFTIRFTKVIVL